MVLLLLQSQTLLRTSSWVQKALSSQGILMEYWYPVSPGWLGATVWGQARGLRQDNAGVGGILWFVEANVFVHPGNTSIRHLLGSLPTSSSFGLYVCIEFLFWGFMSLCVYICDFAIWLILRILGFLCSWVYSEISLKELRSSSSICCFMRLPDEKNRQQDVNDMLKISMLPYLEKNTGSRDRLWAFRAYVYHSSAVPAQESCFSLPPSPRLKLEKG